jgi:putative endonuclease
LLKKKGYKILGRRVRVGRRDELDVVARLKDRLVFVEVKTRRNVDFGRPISSVDRDKRRALSRAAIRYLMDLKERPKFFRFDVIEVVGTPDGGVDDIRHVENAFPLDKKYRVPW